jgi:hypothetical protein
MFDEMDEQERTKLGVLALTGIIGGGALGYAAVTAAGRPGGILGTEGPEPQLGAGDWLVLAIAAGITYEGYREVADQIGWTPLAAGAGIILVTSLLARGGLHNRSRNAGA